MSNKETSSFKHSQIFAAKVQLLKLKPPLRKVALYERK